MDESPKKCSEGHKLRKILMKLYKFPQTWKLVFPSPVFPNRIDPKLFTHIAHPIIYNTNLAACKIDTTVQQSHQWDEQQPICKVLLTRYFSKGDDLPPHHHVRVHDDGDGVDGAVCVDHAGCHHHHLESHKLSFANNRPYLSSWPFLASGMYTMEPSSKIEFSLQTKIGTLVLSKWRY